MKFFLFHEELQLFVVKFKYKEKNTRIQKISERNENLCTREAQIVATQQNYNNQQNYEIDTAMKKFFILLMGKGKKTRLNGLCE